MNKCASFGIQLDGKRKRWLWDTTPFTVGGQPIPALNCRETYRYLGSEIGMLKQGFAEFHAKLRQKIDEGQKRSPTSATKAMDSGQLEKLDRTSRDFIRQILHLPKDLVGLPDDVLRSVTDSGFFQKESQKAARWRVKGERIGGELGELDLHRRLLYSSRDGRGLAGVAEASTNSHDWLRGCTALFNGRDFIDSLKLRGNPARHGGEEG
ncbi:hypothetical protein Avbf_16095 [Armadillidium vulgare]|nr:hypothetical protein Avbf_16095 [Armadillidium vulgare]